MGNLKGLTIYLAGPIDNVPSGVLDWRTKYLPQFKKLGLKVYSPMVKPVWISQDARVKKLSDGTVENMKDRRYIGDAYSSKEVYDVCLSMVSHSDIILCYLPKIFTIGTIDELFRADGWFKPIIFIFEPEGLVSLYAAHLFSRHIVTSSFDNAIDCLKDINKNGIDYLKDFKSLDSYSRWLPITHKAL
jgi:hypothetical protein